MILLSDGAVGAVLEFLGNALKFAIFIIVLPLPAYVTGRGCK